LNVTLHTDGVPDELEGLCSLTEASFFHSPRWFGAIERAEPSWHAGALVARGSDGTVQAALPFVRTARLGLLRVHAGPWGTYGGIVARTPDAAAAVTEALREFASRARVAVVRVHDFAGVGAEPLAAARHWRSVSERCQVLDLVADPQQLFRDAFTSQNRNKIRKAEARGVHVRLARDAAALAQYARLYRETAGRWGAARRLPSALFAALADAGDAVQVWLAEFDEEPVAALLNFRCGGQIMNWGNVSLRKAWRDAPNNLLHWRALQAACRDSRGPRLYNFGGSAGLPGVAAFKAAFGAREHVYARVEYVAPWLAWARPRGS
jgi:hypothetical protein